jgi:hypothetical protein
MEEIGKFGTVAIEDIERFHFQGDSVRLKSALRSMFRQDLIQQRTFLSSRHKKLKVVALTNSGKRLLEQEVALSRPVQKVYAGIKKVAEIDHGTAIYRMYQAEARKIRSSGGKIRRVVLDYELKKQIYQPLAKARRLPADEYENRREGIARANGLAVVDGKIPLPDLRIEYETPGGELGKVDLELVTDRYTDGQLTEKSRAGFKLYWADFSRPPGGSVRDERARRPRILFL